MAGDVLSGENRVPGQENWPALFRRQVTNNARYWAELVAAHPADAPELHRERDNIVKALGRALQLDAAWEPAADLLLGFHKCVERQGALADWERFVQASLEISRRHGDVVTEAALRDRLGELRRDQGGWTAAAACRGRTPRRALCARRCALCRRRPSSSRRQMRWGWMDNDARSNVPWSVASCASAVVSARPGVRWRARRRYGSSGHRRRDAAEV